MCKCYVCVVYVCMCMCCVCVCVVYVCVCVVYVCVCCVCVCKVVSMSVSAHVHCKRHVRELAVSNVMFSVCGREVSTLLNPGGNVYVYQNAMQHTAS